MIVYCFGPKEELSSFLSEHVRTSDQTVVQKRINEEAVKVFADQKKLFPSFEVDVRFLLFKLKGEMDLTQREVDNGMTNLRVALLSCAKLAILSAL